MPTGYAGEGKTFLKSLGKWVTKKKEKAVDYDTYDKDVACLIISFFRWYPDYYADLCRSPDARYQLELPQRVIMRSIARYRNSYTTGCRGLTKTYLVLLTNMILGIFYPGEIIRYSAPNQKQAAVLASQAYKQIEKEYPIIAACWAVKNDRNDMFRIETIYGSQFTMFAPRGDNCSCTIAEEIGAEGSGFDAFDMEKYEKDILPTCRLDRRVNQKPDRTHINLKHTHISNACSRQNRAYSVHRNDVLRKMLCGDKYEGIVMDIPWEVALIGNIRDIEYIEDMKSKLSHTDWLREMCARYTGTGENPMVADEDIAKAKKLMVMEDKHCGDANAIYVVAHDVSYVDTRANAKCSDVVLKLTDFKAVQKRDKFRKQSVYVDNYPPPATDYIQAQKLKKLWLKYCLDGAQTTYLVIDAQAYGTSVIEELMKPTDDGTPPLCCVNHMAFTHLEQPDALPVIYPLKSGGRGVTDEEGAMIRYIQNEFEKGNIELLTTAVADGVSAYKVFHDIKDGAQDGTISLPYKNTELLCQQISNLRTKVSGISLKEERQSKAIQRDIWSALKYAARYAQILEDERATEKYKAKSSWADIIKNQANMAVANKPQGNTRHNLLANRRR